MLNIIANMLPSDNPILGMVSSGQGQIFQNMVMLLIKLQGITKSSIMHMVATWLQLYRLNYFY